jgi:hypothetical protein
MSLLRNRRGVVSALVAVACVVFGYQAHAISVEGAKGIAADPNQQMCFSSTISQAVVNDSCSGSVTWIVPLAANAGSHTVRIRATRSGTLSCSLCDTTQSGLATCVNFPTFPTGGSSQTATVSVPSNGSLYARCNLGLNSAITTINYNQ